MILCFFYGQLLRPGPYTATINGEMRMRTGTDPAARFGPQYPGRVYGQLYRKNHREIESLVYMEAPQYALHRIGSVRGESIYGFVDVQPQFEYEPIVPSGMFEPEKHENRALYVAKARRYGQGHKPPGKTKVVVTEARLNAMQQQMERPIKVNLLGGIESIKENLSADAMREAFMRRDYSKVLDQVTPHIEAATANAVGTAVRGVHNAITDKLPQGARDVLQYNPANPRIASYIDKRAGNLITTTEDGLKQAVQAMTANAMTRGMNAKQSAQYVRNVIGLNAPQSLALANYQAGLTVADVHPDRIATLVDAYANKMLDQRAEMIARTEVRNAQNFGQLDIWKQGTEDGLLPKESRKVWQVDGNPCPEWCEQMDGESVALDEMWVVTNTRTGKVIHVDVPSSTHPSCMCLMTIDMGEA